MKNHRSTIVGFAVLVVLLSAGAAQGLAGSNTVTSDDIVDFSIVANDIKTAAIGGRPIVDNSMTGADVNESTLSLTCPSAAPTRVGGVCFTAVRAVNDLIDAMKDCGDERLRLPTIEESVAVPINEGLTLWTSAIYNNVGLKGITVTGSSTLSTAVDAATEVSYRCAIDVGARP